MSKLLEALKAQAEIGKAKVQSETTDITVLEVVDAPFAPADIEKKYPRVRVSTAEFGNIWLFKNNVHNLLSSYGKGVAAKATLVPNKYTNKQGVEVDGVAVRSIRIEAIDSKTEQMIASLKPGTALFAMAV